MKKLILQILLPSLIVLGAIALLYFKSYAIEILFLLIISCVIVVWRTIKGLNNTFKDTDAL